MHPIAQIGSECTVKGAFYNESRNKDRMSGAAMGMLAGATVGAMGMYLNARHPAK